MRLGGGGLPLLILALTVAAAAPAGAEDLAGFDPRGGVVDVGASTRAPGGESPSGGDGPASACTWRVVVADDNVRAIFGPEGDRLFSDTGRWLQLECNGQAQAVNGQFVVPEGGAVSIADLLEQAYNQLDPPLPVWSASPNGLTVAMVTQLPTWLWIDDGYWNGGFTARASTPSGRVWAEARVHPLSAVWEFGDGSTVRCKAGSAYAPGAGNGGSSCTHTFRHSSAGIPGISLEVTVAFAVEGVTSQGTTVALGELSRTSAPVVVQVAEIQAIETQGR